jgi:hypothetical protein
VTRVVTDGDIEDHGCKVRSGVEERTRFPGVVGS